MAKKRRNVKTQKKKQSQPSFKQTISRSQQLANEFYRFKVHHSHEVISIQKTLYDLKRESVNASMYISALLDLISEVTSVPMNVLAGRFMQHCESKQIITNMGQVKGGIEINKYHFTE